MPIGMSPERHEAIGCMQAQSSVWACQRWQIKKRGAELALRMFGGWSWDD